jgi:hypothetical protein
MAALNLYFPSLAVIGLDDLLMPVRSGGACVSAEESKRAEAQRSLCSSPGLKYMVDVRGLWAHRGRSGGLSVCNQRHFFNSLLLARSGVGVGLAVGWGEHMGRS